MAKSTRGGSLGSVLLLVATLTVAAFAVATAATWSLQVSSRVENQQIALELADSVAHQALAELMYKPDYGQDGRANLVIRDIAGMPQGAIGQLTFERNSGLPFSTNNLSGATPDGWEGRAVPASRTHLVAVGRCRGVERRIEMMVYSPRFPRAIACGGPVELRSSLVAAVRDLNSVVDASGNLVLPEGDLQRGDVVCNDTQLLRDGTRVKGSAQALVSVVQRDNSVVEGEVLAPYEAAQIPQFRASDYDPQNDPDTLYTPHASGTTGPLSLSGITRFDNGDVTVQGDLGLDNGLAYVAGNLRVTGSLQGVGAIIVGGTTEIGKAVRLSTSDNVALISQGDLRLRGDGQERSFFQGLLCTGGVLSADHLTIVGAAIAQQRIWISHCNVIYYKPEAVGGFFRKTSLASDRANIVGGLGQKRDPDKGFMTSYFPSALPGQQTVTEALTGNYDWYKPGALEIEKKDGNFLYTYRYIHHQERIATVGPSRDKDWFVAEVADLLCNEWRRRQSYLVSAQAATAFKTHCRQGLLDSIAQAVAYKAAVVDGVSVGNFDLSPNRFLSEAEQLRVLYRREL